MFVALLALAAGDFQATGDAGSSWSGPDASKCLIVAILCGVSALGFLIAAFRSGRDE